METSSRNVRAQLSPEKGLVASACPSRARQYLQRDPQLSSLQRHDLKEQAWADHFCRGLLLRWAGQGGGVECARVCACVYCVSGLFVERLTLYPEQPGYQRLGPDLQGSPYSISSPRVHHQWILDSGKATPKPPLLPALPL